MQTTKTRLAPRRGTPWAWVLSMMALPVIAAGCITTTGRGSAFFDTPQEIVLELLDPSVEERNGAVGLLLKNLGRLENVDTSRASRYWLVSVTVSLGVRREPWEVPLHLVWPQESDRLRLLAWSANNRPDATMGALARSKAVDDLMERIRSATVGSEAPLYGRIRLAEPSL